MELTHASFFSGVGGTDLGLERAGWRTVSFSEIDPYACAVLAERWPGVPNVGDILDLQRAVDGEAGSRQAGNDGAQSRLDGWLRVGSGRDGGAWADATLWSGGFPCQDLSVAGKRAGMGEGTRSGLAYAFLALVERHRPPAILLENVPGLLSSYRGRDMAALLGRMVELGYGVAYRVLDAQHFGVPQRRRRVFIVGLRCDPDDVDGRAAASRAAAVLSVGTRCGRHPATGHEAGTGVASGTTASALSASAGHHGHSSPRGDGSDNIIYNATAKFGEWQQDSIAGNLSQRDYKSSNHLISAPPDADRVRAADGLAGRAHDRPSVVRALPADSRGNDEEAGYGPLVTQSLPTQRVGTDDNDAQGGFMTISDGIADPLLPLGLDSHRYRCCGNGVVAPVAEWLGWRLREALS